MKKKVRKFLPINFLFRCLDSSTYWKPVRIKMRETVLIAYCNVHDFCQEFAGVLTVGSVVKDTLTLSSTRFTRKYGEQDITIKIKKKSYLGLRLDPALASRGTNFIKCVRISWQIFGEARGVSDSY